MTWLFLALTIVGSQGREGLSDEKRSTEIVFVCEHGAALSVISAAYFNKLARAQGLSMHAIARGTAPQEELSRTAHEGLKDDGIKVETTIPQALSDADVVHARRIIAFSPIPARYARKARVETWSDVSWPPANYKEARDAIVQHLQALIQELKAGN